MREFGIRVALGASRREILRVVLFSEVRAATTGIGIGALLACCVQRVMRSVLELAPMHIWLVMPACLAMLIVSVIANLFPAREAAHVALNTILQSE